MATVSPGVFVAVLNVRSEAFVILYIGVRTANTRGYVQRWSDRLQRRQENIEGATEMISISCLQVRWTGLWNS